MRETKTLRSKIHKKNLEKSNDVHGRNKDCIYLSPTYMENHAIKLYFQLNGSQVSRETTERDIEPSTVHF